MVSLHFAKHEYWGSIFWDNNPFLYHLLLKFWVRYAGDLEESTRLLSVLFSTGTTGLMMSFGNLLFGFYGLVLFGLYHAVSHLSIVYAQETRMYALFEFATALNMVFFYKIYFSDKNQKQQKVNLGTQISYFGSVILLGLSQYLAVVPFVLQGVAAAALAYRKPLSERSKKNLILGFILGVLVLAISYFYFFSWGHLSWQKAKFELEPQSRLPGAIVWNLCNESVMAVYGIFFMLITSYWLRRKIKAKDSANLFYYFVLSPLIIFLVANYVSGRAMFLPRYFIYTVPYFIAGLGTSTVFIFNRQKKYQALCFIALAFIVIGSLSSLPHLYEPRKAPWREVAAEIDRHESSLILTTRTDAIQTPYFTRIKVPVIRVLKSDEMFDKVRDELSHYKTIWILENYWGGTSYFARLKEEFQFNQIKVSQYSVKNEYSEPVLVMKITGLLK